MVKKVLDKDRRKCNIIIFNLADTNSFYDDKRNLGELMRDLKLNESMIESISRIGRPSAKTRPLRIQMCSEMCRNMFLDAAYLLKFMKQKWPKLGISPDRVPKEIDSHRKFMLDFRRRRDQGENVCLDGDKIVPNIIRSHLPNTQQKLNTLSISSMSTTPSSSSLRVNLPPIIHPATVGTPSPLRVNLPPITASVNTYATHDVSRKS